MKINIAIRADLGKMCFESFTCARSLAHELTYMLKHTRKFFGKSAQSGLHWHIFTPGVIKTVTVWCHTDYESMELSVHAHRAK